MIALELGWGEPAGENFPGATRNPAEWCDLLRKEGRTVELVRLRTDLQELERRAASRGHGWKEVVILRYNQYEKDPDVVSLPKRIETRELVFDTSQAEIDDVVTAILAKLENGPTENEWVADDPRSAGI